MMNLFDEKCERIRQLFDNVEQLLTELTQENFNLHIAKINDCQAELQQLNKSLISEYPKDKIENINREVMERAKQISQIFDNTITVWKSDVSLVKSELEMLQNQKKLSRYQR